MCTRRLGYVLFMVGLVGIHGCNRAQNQGQEEHPSIRIPSANLAPTAPMGSPAIRPRNNGTRAFSVEDAKQYIATHQLLMGLAKGGKPTIVNAEFMSSKEVSEHWNGTTTGFPDDYQLCYIELDGPVTFVGPSGLKVTYNKAVLIFDAHSGNLVFEGGRP